MALGTTSCIPSANHTLLLIHKVEKATWPQSIAFGAPTAVPRCNSGALTSRHMMTMTLNSGQPNPIFGPSQLTDPAIMSLLKVILARDGYRIPAVVLDTSVNAQIGT